VVWQQEHDHDGALRYILRMAPGFLPMATLSRVKRREWTLCFADGVMILRGELRAAKNQTEGMLGL
jgi:hypothetical protein